MICWVLGISFLLPLVWMFSTALKPPGLVFETPIRWIPENPRWYNYPQVFEKLPLFSRFFVNTFYVTLMGASGCVLSSLLVGFGLSRINWPGRNAVFGMLIATLMLPGVVTIIPLYIIFRYAQLVGTFYPLWIPAWFGYAFYIFLMRQYMMTLPRELDEAARMDGAANFRILWQIITPLCSPAIATIAIFAFLQHYNDFLGPLLYISANEMFTLQLGLLWFQGRFGNFWHLVMAASVMTIVPVLVLFFTAQKRFVQGIQLTGLAGR
ncbi:MAG: carbohydrate ABC transporter permease [Caldilineaceae bacterium SB0665_bin_21]|nr:carbohydrate ABC transporter permease [Caldilineaceae bacterium SB0665_bin_21]MYC63821.1 carbohydrate ABC transporter permease [Caldilineaceae bacterium SB0661_bin_34]